MVVAFALVACGKTGDPALEAVNRADVVDVYEPEFRVHFERHGREFSYDTVTVRHDKADVERRSNGVVDASIVDAFLHAIADGRIKPNATVNTRIRVSITPRTGEAQVEVHLHGTEEPYRAMMANTGPSANAP